jgi:hypothetical protein
MRGTATRVISPPGLKCAPKPEDARASRTGMRRWPPSMGVPGKMHPGSGRPRSCGRGLGRRRYRHERHYVHSKITERLVKAGYTEAQLGNFWSGNALRVLGKAHDARKQAG